MSTPFSSPQEFREVMDRPFATMSDDPRLKAPPTLVSITKPVYARYRATVTEQHPHLAV